MVDEINGSDKVGFVYRAGAFFISMISTFSIVFIFLFGFKEDFYKALLGIFVCGFLVYVTMPVFLRGTPPKAMRWAAKRDMED